MNLRPSFRNFAGSPRAASSANALLAVLLFVALTWARTAGISENFWLLGEQIRDWSVALGPWHDLPLSGTPSTVGGRSLGPVYYWLLWVIRVTVGPFFDNLPHAGGVGLSMFQAGADVALFIALRRHTSSAALALATVLLVATAPYDMALTATIWNPPVSVAFVKFTLAMFLTSARHPSRWRMAATVATGWLAVQAHSSAIFVFAPVAAWFVVRELTARRWGPAAQTLRLIVEIVAVLQIPFLVDRLTAAGAGAPTVAIQSLSRILADPSLAAPRVAFGGIADALTYLWAHPFDVPWIAALLLAAATGVAFRGRSQPWLLFATIAPVGLTVAAFSGWQQSFQVYYFLTLAPAAALMVALAINALPLTRLKEVMALVFLLVVAYTQSTRLSVVVYIHKLPEYGPLIRGTREIARRTPEIRDIFTEFPLPPSTDATFPFVCLGGRVTTAAAYNAFIAADGGVSYRPTRQP